MSKEKQKVIIPLAKRSPQTSYTPKVNRGIPVPEGCTLQDLSTEQRQQIMRHRENEIRNRHNENAKKNGEMEFSHEQI